MSNDPLFAPICLQLLSNKMVCAQTDIACYEYLLLEDKAQRVNDHMMQMDRKLIATPDNKVFYLGYRYPDQAESITAIRAQFKQVVNDLEILVRWLRFATNTSATGRPLSPGDVLSDSVLLSSIQGSHTQFQLLKEIAQSRMVKSTSSDGKGMIRAVMARLTEMEYFVPTGVGGMQHVATGRWSWLYDVMSFIRSHEDLPDVTASDDQVGLL